VDQPELAAEVQAEGAEDTRDHRGLVSHEEDGRAGVAAEAGELALAEELRDRRRHFAVLAVDEVGEPFRAPLLRNLFELRQLGTAELTRNTQEADRGGLVEDLELRAAGHVGRVLDLEA